METQKVIDGSSIISVPTGSVDKVIEKIVERGCPAEELSLSERKKTLKTETPDPGYTMIRVFHRDPIEEVMAGILKRVI